MSRFNPIRIDKGEGIDVHLVFRDDNDAVVNLEDATVEVYEASTTALRDAITVTCEQLPDADNVTNWGAHAVLLADDAWPDSPAAAILRMGNVQWFRVRVKFDEGRPDSTDERWVSVE